VTGRLPEPYKKDGQAGFMSMENTENLKNQVSELRKEVDKYVLELRNVKKEREILKKQLEKVSFEQRIRELLEVLNTSMTVVEPKGYLQMIKSTLKTTREILGAEWSSILLVDKKKGELVLETDPEREKPMVFRFPLGEGIAGTVAVTGEPIIATDVQADPRWKKEIAEATGYHPKSILCVPLIYNEEIIGVVEAFDKRNNTSFSLEDMNLLSTMADLLSILIHNMSIYKDINSIFLETLKKLSTREQMDLKGEDLTEQITEYAIELSQKMELSSSYQETLKLAVLIHEIAEQGSQASEFCKKLLREFLDYLHRVEDESKIWSF